MGQVKLWTPEDDSILRKYASEGKLSIECAKVLGRNRSSVLGRASRLGVSFCRNITIKFEKSKNENTDKPKIKEKKVFIVPLEKRPFRFFSNIPKPFVTPRYEQPEAATTPFGTPRSLLKLEEHHCRWPCFESPKSGRQMFCCADRMAGKPYCADHQALVYIKKTFAEVKI